ncbi:MAG TPA: hypothetical protein VFX59_08465 [Polyangiales bacterium]|nr:hypothetical protein [Polyangiales bacterium]
MHTEPSYNARERTIIRSVYHALRPFMMTESAFQASVTRVQRRVVRFTRARYLLAERQIERRTEPAPVDAAEELEALITPTFDPWSARVDDLRSATRQHTACTRCQGKRSKGCARCLGSGRVYTWLDVAQTTRVEVFATPRKVAEHWLSRALDESDFLEEEYLHECEQDLVLPADAMTGLDKVLRPQLADNDRVSQICLQTFAVDLHEVHYETAFGDGMVEVAGEPLTVFDAARQPLSRRNSVARVFALAAAAVAIAAPILYRAQHPWFEKYGAAASALLVGLGASGLLGMALLGWLRAHASRTAISTWIPTAAALGLAALSTAMLASTKPSIADARDALEKRDMERARVTADALYWLGAPRDEQRVLHDEIRLARMDLTDSLGAKLTIATSEGWTPQRKAAMESAILHVVNERAEHARALADGPSLVRLAEMIRPLLPSEAHTLTVEAAAHESHRCMLKAEPRCIERSAAELDRLGAHALAAQSRRVLVTLVRQRFEHALEAVAHSRSAKAELERLTTAQILARKLSELGAPPPSGTLSLIERGIKRTEAQVHATNVTAVPEQELGPLASAY